MQKPIAGSIRKKGNYYYYTFQKNGKRYLDIPLKEGEYRNAIKKANALYIDTADEEELTPNAFAPLLYAYLDREKIRVDKGQLSISTYKEKRRILTTHILGYFGQNKDINTITVLDIEDYCDLKLETLNANTVVKHYHYLNAFFKHLCKIDVLMKNIVDLADHPSRVKSETPDTFTKEEVMTYLDNLEKDNESSLAFRIAIVNAIFGGMRRGEAIGVKADSVKFIQAPNNANLKYVKITVKDTITTADNEVIYKGTKTYRERQVVFTPLSYAPLFSGHF